MNCFWEFGEGIQSSCNTCEQPQLTVIDQSEVILTLTDAFGCAATDTLIIGAEKIRDVWMPNVLTPNGDGVNDVLYLQGRANASFKNFKVFDRWGQEVFFRNSGEINQEMDGWMGKNVEVGVYYWTAEIVYPDQSVEPKQGVITLLK